MEIHFWYQILLQYCQKLWQWGESLPLSSILLILMLPFSSHLTLFLFDTSDSMLLKSDYIKFVISGIFENVCSKFLLHYFSLLIQGSFSYTVQGVLVIITLYNIRKAMFQSDLMSFLSENKMYFESDATMCLPSMGKKVKAMHENFTSHLFSQNFVFFYFSFFPLE